jgi:anthranilate 1,2-dioxygenase (deaminating, decarboxylating) large subunit
MKYPQHLLLVAGLSLVALLVGPAAAYDQPLGLNLGATSFLDGIPPAGPGLYFSEYIQYYTADKFSDAPHNPLGQGPAKNAKIDAWISLNQFIYQSNQPVLFGGKWGLDVIVPVASIDAQDRNGILLDNAAGLGDIYVGPFLQWDPIMGKNGPIFSHRVEFQTIWPTGKYDNEKNLNPGSNYFSFDPYWAFTWFALPRVEVSGRIHYLWNDKNDDPFIGSGAIDDTQAGQAWHANFAASYEVLPKQLRVGFNGYYLKQFESSKVDGDKQGMLEEVLGIGPGALWSFSQDTHLFFNAYFETNTEARPEGDRFYLRLVHHF